MDFYYYTIVNLINQKQYIGITEYPELRRQQHWRRLQNNSHPNPKLQHAVNKYGLDHFQFYILEHKIYNSKEEGYQYEQKLIEQFNTLEEGYNCNPGGQWTGPKARFNKQQVFYIKSACYYNGAVCGVISRYYGISIDIIAGIRSKRNYRAWGEEFEKLPEQEKIAIYNEFCDLTNFNLWKDQAKIKVARRKYTKEEVFIILRWCETKFTSAKNICDALNISYPDNPEYHPANKFRAIREGKTYRDYIAEYNQLTILEKQNIERLYAERHIANLVNCGETQDNGQSAAKP